MQSLSLELNLDSGKYTGRMQQAGRVTQTFERNVAGVNSTLGRMDVQLERSTHRLRDFVLVMGNIRSAVENTRFFFTGLAEAAINATSEMERTFNLLKGLSNSDTGAGRILDATQNLEYLIDAAKRAPFSVQALSDTFVKFTAGGIDPMAGGFENLIDAVAAFGGTDETLKRASVAIQQMGGKGVISMEELRQQLGEAVPTAINLMAKGMKKSYEDLVKEISLGKVRAEPALKAMFEQMEIAYGGSAQRMMESYAGRVAQVKTSLVELAMAFTGMNTDGSTVAGGFFDTIKNALADINDLLGSDGFRSQIADLGSAFGDITRTAGTALSVMGDIVSVIPGLNDVKVVTYAIAGGLAAWGASAILGGIGGVIGLMTNKYRQMQAELAMVNAIAVAGRNSAAQEAATAAQATKDAAVKVAALREQQRQLQTNIALARQQRQEAEAARARAGATAALTGDLSYAAEATSRAAVEQARKAELQTKKALRQTNLELAAAESALANAQANQLRTRGASAVAEGVATRARQANTTATGLATRAYQTFNATIAASVSGTRNLASSMAMLTTAQGRAAVSARALAAAQGALNGVKVAGAVAGRGLMAVLAPFGGPFGVLIMGAIAGLGFAFTRLKETMKSASETAKEFQEIQNREVGALQALADLQRKYGGDVAGTEAAIAELMGVTEEANKITDAAARSAYLRANEEKKLTAQLYERLAAEAELAGKEAKKRGDTSRVVGFGMGIAKHLPGPTSMVNQLFPELYRSVTDRANQNAVRHYEEATTRFRARQRYAEAAAKLYREKIDPAKFEQEFQSGSSAGSTPSKDSGGKSGGGKSAAERAADRVSRMAEQVIGIEAEMAGAGKEAAKMAFLLDSGSGSEFAGLTGKIAKDLMDAARAVDHANEQMEGFKAFESLTKEAEKQEEIAERLRAEIELIAKGQGEMVVDNARYRAGLSDQLKTAEKYEETAGRIVDRAAAAQRNVSRLNEHLAAVKAIGDALASQKLASQYAWEDYISGASESSRELNNFRRQMTEHLAKMDQTGESYRAAKAEAEAAIKSFEMSRATRGLIDMRNEVQEINLALSGMSSAAQRSAAFERQAAENYRNYVDIYVEGTYERWAAEQQFMEWKQAKERETVSKNPMVSQMMQWGDMWGNLTQASTDWSSSFIDGLFDAEMAWDEFAANMLKQIAKIILQAMIAKAVLSALGMMGMGGGETLFATSAPQLSPVNGFMPSVVAHTGAIVGGQGNASRMIPASMFANAFKYHVGGIAGLKPREVPSILQEGEGVFTREQMANLAPVGSLGAPSVQVNVINESGTPLDAQQSGGGMKFDGKNYVLDVVIDAISKPGKMRDAFKGAVMA